METISVVFENQSGPFQAFVMEGDVLDEGIFSLTLSGTHKKPESMLVMGREALRDALVNFERNMAARGYRFVPHGEPLRGE
jgi:hypothetical protein